MQKVEKTDAKVNRNGVQPVASSTQKIEAPAAQDYTKVLTVKLAFWLIFVLVRYLLNDSQLVMLL